jgi:hypothetical protein
MVKKTVVVDPRIRSKEKGNKGEPERVQRKEYKKHGELSSTESTASVHREGLAMPSGGRNCPGSPCSGGGSAYRTVGDLLA